MITYLDGAVTFGPFTPDGWQFIDFSPYIPNYANGVILQSNASLFNYCYYGELEPQNDELSFQTTVNDAGFYPTNGPGNVLCPVNSDLKQWVFLQDDVDDDFILVGYTASPGVVFFGDYAHKMLPTTVGGFSTEDISGLVPANAKAVICNMHGANGRLPLVRPTGSTISKTWNGPNIGRLYHGTQTVIFALDGTQQFDTDHGNDDGVATIVGYITEGTWYNDIQNHAYAGGSAAYGTATITELTDQFQSPVLFSKNNTAHARRIGATTDYQQAIGGHGGNYGAKPNASKQIELYNTTSYYLCGFLSGLPPVPSNFSVTQTTDNDTRLDVSFDAPGSGVTTKVFWRPSSGGAWSDSGSLTGATSTFQITSLSANTEYEVKASYTNNYGTGSETAVTTIRTTKTYTVKTLDELGAGAARDCAALAPVASANWIAEGVIKLFTTDVNGDAVVHIDTRGTKPRWVLIPDGLTESGDIAVEE